MRYTITILVLFLSFISYNSAHATDPISPEWSEVAKEHKVEKVGFFGKVKKWIKKKAEQIQEAWPIKKWAILGFIIGAVSLLGWVLISVVGGWFLWVMFFGAIAGDIISIYVLLKTAKAKKENKAARTWAIWGLILSLLTGLLPLALLILVLVSV